MAGEKVLIIDDSAELRSLLETVLPYGGYETVSASTGKRGIELVSEVNPDVIMVDLELPDTTGLKVLEELKQQGVTIPTIMMTGYGSEGVAARALGLGVHSYLIKPFTTEEVLASIEKALSVPRLRRENEGLAALVEDYVLHFQMIHALSRSVISGLDLDRLLQRVVEAGLYVTRSDNVLVLLLDESSGHLEVAASRGQVGRSSNRIPQSTGDERLHQALKEGVVARIHSPSEPSIRLQTGDTVRAVLQVPLEARGQILGLISADRRDNSVPFARHDQQMLSILADYVVMALKNHSGV